MVYLIILQSFEGNDEKKVANVFEENKCTPDYAYEIAIANFCYVLLLTVVYSLQLQLRHWQ